MLSVLGKKQWLIAGCPNPFWKSSVTLIINQFYYLICKFRGFNYALGLWFRHRLICVLFISDSNKITRMKGQNKNNMFVISYFFGVRWMLSGSFLIRRIQQMKPNPWFQFSGRVDPI